MRKNLPHPLRLASHDLSHPAWCERERCFCDVERDGTVSIYHARRIGSLILANTFEGAVEVLPGGEDTLTNSREVMAHAWDYVRAAPLMAALNTAHTLKATQKRLKQRPTKG